MLAIRRLTKFQKFITLLSGMATAAAIVIAGFPERPSGIEKFEFLLLLWFVSFVMWGAFMLLLDILAKAQKPTKAESDESQNGQA